MIYSSYCIVIITPYWNKYLFDREEKCDVSQIIVFFDWTIIPFIPRFAYSS